MAPQPAYPFTSSPYSTSSNSMASQPLGPNCPTPLLASGTTILPASIYRQRPFLQPPSTNGGVRPNFAQAPRSVRSGASINESRYNASTASHGPVAPSISEKFSLSPDPAAWGADITNPEPDDFLHNPDPKRDRKTDADGNVFHHARSLQPWLSSRVGPGDHDPLVAGYPIISHFTSPRPAFFGGFNVGGINSSGQNPGTELQLVFSDEFELDGRSFYPGDDPYWEAVDLHYWQTNNLEWYDPAAVTTKNGALEITLSQKENHGLDYQGGLISSWNKFCFTGGLIVTAVTLPGPLQLYNFLTSLQGPTMYMGFGLPFGPMGNLGRAGFGASLEGIRTHTIHATSGRLRIRQSTGLPEAATINGDKGVGGVPSFLVSACQGAPVTGSPHPGPVHADGTYVGRSAPEIDIFEAQISDGAGQVSQSAQWGPFNNEYIWFNTSDNLIIPDPANSVLNTYIGGAFQQATSVVTNTNQECYQLINSTCFSIYGFEYQPGFANAYISWIANDKIAWTLNQAGMAADTAVEIGPRPVPQEPLYIIANLGMSENFGVVDFEHLTFPAVMRVDYIRVYQPKDAINIGCDPEAFPTQAYINEYLPAYTNPNFTTWRDDFGQPFPKSSQLGQC
ncbi:beta-glucan synthesis-associated protein [Mycena alexandri]|uniref:Beta-glucan synthesis-associated protein n=1 Tax=Mycena alexandri TaxID=1745969 RepID=A0AAD6TCB0_9AGAR|nr:beta-glucan synthesis-associated protein [Mycena alexandri]